MGLKVAIFEDNKDVADIIKQLMEEANFEVVNCYSLKKKDWQDADVVLGDFRNEIVAFAELRQKCAEHGIPLIAISGAETGYRPQLIKPFGIEDLQAIILQELMTRKKLGENPRKKPSGVLAWLRGLFD